VTEIGDLERRRADLAVEGRDLVMGQLQEILEQAQLVHHLQRRGVNGVAAEVAQEIGMLLQHQHLDAEARQEQAQHHAGGAAAGDAAAYVDAFRFHARLPFPPIQRRREGFGSEASAGRRRRRPAAEAYCFSFALTASTSAVDISPTVVISPFWMRHRRKGPVMSPYSSNCTGPMTPS